MISSSSAVWVVLIVLVLGFPAPHLPVLADAMGAQLFGSAYTLDGEPVESAVVRLCGPVDGETDTDHYGRFRFVGLPAGNYSIAIIKQGLSMVNRPRILLTTARAFDQIGVLMTQAGAQSAPADTKEACHPNTEVSHIRFETRRK